MDQQETDKYNKMVRKYNKAVTMVHDVKQEWCMYNMSFMSDRIMRIEESPITRHHADKITELLEEWYKK